MVLAIDATMQRIADEPLGVEPDDQSIGPRWRPRFVDTAHFEMSPLQRLKKGVARTKCRRDPISRIDFLHHAPTIGGLAQNKFHQLRSAGEDGEPEPTPGCRVDPRRIARQTPQHRISSLAAAILQQAMAPALTDPYAVAGGARTKGVGESLGDLTVLTARRIKCAKPTTSAEVHQIVAPAFVRPHHRPVGDQQPAIAGEANRISGAQGVTANLCPGPSVIRAAEDAHFAAVDNDSNAAR